MEFFINLFFKIYLKKLYNLQKKIFQTQAIYFAKILQRRTVQIKFRVIKLGSDTIFNTKSLYSKQIQFQQTELFHSI